MESNPEKRTEEERKEKNTEETKRWFGGYDERKGKERTLERRQ